MKRLAVEFRDQHINMSLPAAGVLTACITVVDKSDREPDRVDEVQLELGGLDPIDNKHPCWGRFDLVCGDSVVIAVHDDRVSDPEIARTGQTPDERLESKRNYVRRVAAELGWTITET
jgi:hypothetical protein